MLPLEMSIGVTNGYFSLLISPICCERSLRIYSIYFWASFLFDASIPLGYILSSLITGLIEMETFLAYFGILLSKLAIFYWVWVWLTSDSFSFLVWLFPGPTSTVISMPFPLTSYFWGVSFSFLVSGFGVEFFSFGIWSAFFSFATSVGSTFAVSLETGDSVAGAGASLVAAASPPSVTLTSTIDLWLVSASKSSSLYLTIFSWFVYAFWLASIAAFVS